MQHLTKSFTFLLLISLICSHSLEIKDVMSSNPHFLAPKSSPLTPLIDQAFLTAKNSESLAKALVPLAPKITHKRDLLYLASKLGELDTRKIPISDEEKIDLFEQILTLAPGNPLNQETYQFVRNGFFIPLIVKEEALQLKFYAQKKEKREIALLDLGSGNGSVLWLLRQLLIVLGISKQRVFVVDHSIDLLDRNKKINDDLNEDSFYLGDISQTELWSSQAAKNLNLPVFDGVFIRHTLHEVYTQKFLGTRDKEMALEGIQELLNKVSSLMDKEAVFSIHDAFLPDDPNERITIRFKDNEKGRQMALAWKEFQIQSKALGLDKEFGLDTIEEINEFPADYNAALRVSRKTYVHFLSKAWYLVNASSLNEKTEFELQQICCFATKSEIIEMLRKSGLHPFFSLRLKENHFLDFVNGSIQASQNGNPDERFLPWQFAGMLSTKEKPFWDKPFVPSHDTYDGPVRNWFDSLEYRTGRRLIEKEMFEGMNDAVSQIGAGISGQLSLLRVLGQKKGLFSESQDKAIQDLLDNTQKFKTNVDDVVQFHKQGKISLSEMIATIESYAMWKINVLKMIHQLLTWIELIPLPDDSRLHEVIVDLKDLANRMDAFERYFEPQWEAFPPYPYSHYQLFIESVGKDQNEFGWIKRHIHFQVSHPFYSEWGLNEEEINIDLENFRLILYLLFFIGKENAMPRKGQAQDSPLTIKVRKIKGNKIKIELTFVKEEPLRNPISTQEKVRFAQKVAFHLGGKFVLHEKGKSATISFQIPNGLKNSSPPFIDIRPLESAL